MSTMSKTLLAVLVGILVGGATYVMAAPPDKNSSAAKTAPATMRTTTSTVDVSGPCDEAEHANDPRCAGPQRPEDVDRPDDFNRHDGLDDRPNHDVGDDRGGLRHEAEPGDDNDNRGPGSRNSGPGSLHSDDGPSHDVGDNHGADDGPAHDVGDDHGGSGSGSSGSGSSGSGGSGSGHSGGSDD